MLEYDDVMNKQRRVVYDQRDASSRARTSASRSQEMVEEVVTAVVEGGLEGEYPEEWDLDGLFVSLQERVRPDLRPERPRHHVG